MKAKPLQKNIPEGWKAIPVGDVFTFVKSYAFSRENLVHDTLNDEGIGNIHYGDIHSTFSTPSIDLKKISVPMIKDSGFAPKSEDYLKDGDLIMADASEDYEGVGVTVSLHGMEGKKIIGGLHTFVLRDTKNKTDKYFRQYIFRNPEIRNSLQKIANGVSVYGISKTAVSKLLLPIPSLTEQKRIVAVLETWDRAIEKLVKKIEVKKKIKSGLMQELLIGKTRLLGFTGVWKTLRIGSVGKVVTGNTPSKKVLDYYGGKYLWATALDFNGVYIEDTKIKLSESGKNVARVVPAGSILVTCIASIGKNAIAKKPMSFNQQINAIIPSNNFHSEFVYYLIENSLSKLREVAGGGSLAMISKSVFENIKLNFPKKEEQIVIAEILTTADHEIEELKQKLSLLQDQKRYLLNNLITGTIRTPETLSTHN